MSLWKPSVDEVDPDVSHPHLGELYQGTLNLPLWGCLWASSQDYWEWLGHRKICILGGARYCWYYSLLPGFNPEELWGNIRIGVSLAVSLIPHPLWNHRKDSDFLVWVMGPILSQLSGQGTWAPGVKMSRQENYLESMDCIFHRKRIYHRCSGVFGRFQETWRVLSF